MKFNETKHTHNNEREIESQRLYSALHESFEWILDIAAELVEPYPEEVEAIERVRTFARAKLTGRHAPVRITDLLLTFSVLMTGIERRRGPSKNAPTLEAAFDRAAQRIAFGHAVQSLLKVFRISPSSLPWMPAMARQCPGADADVTYHAPHVH